jgi:hypothetical protein
MVETVDSILTSLASGRLPLGFSDECMLVDILPYFLEYNPGISKYQFSQPLGSCKE